MAKKDLDLTDAAKRRTGQTPTSRKAGRAAQWPPSARDKGGSFFPSGDAAEGRTDRPAGHQGRTR